MIRVHLPVHLRTLAGTGKEVQLEVAEPITQRTVLDALENVYPALRGAIRDQQSLERRPLVRFFACKRDLSHEPLDANLPDEVAEGREPYLIVGAMAGGCDTAAIAQVARNQCDTYSWSTEVKPNSMPMCETTATSNRLRLHAISRSVASTAMPHHCTP